MHSRHAKEDGIQTVATRVRLVYSFPLPSHISYIYDTFSFTSYSYVSHRYAEVLENTQFALIATVHKLYSMVRSGQQWDLDEPDLNDRGQPVIHNIAQKLGCIRPNNDIDLPVHSVFPEDEQGLSDLARQLEEQQLQADKALGGGNNIHNDAHNDAHTDRASSSELDHSDVEDYRKAAFGGGGGGGGGPGSITTASPVSLTYDSFDNYSAPSTESIPSATSPTESMSTSYGPWMRGFPTSFNAQFVQSSGAFEGMDMLNQGLLESEFGALKPHIVSCPNPEVMMGLGDPMIYSGFDPEAMRGM